MDKLCNNSTSNHVNKVEIDNVIEKLGGEVKNSKNMNDYVEQIVNEFKTPKFMNDSYKMIKKN